MPVIHYLNVNEGDCSVITHYSGHVTVVDVCNARPDTGESRLAEAIRKSISGLDTSGNFQQKKHPVNPILYLKEHGTTSVFRFILTHPDMDHMDGIKDFFEEFSPLNFWDTDNTSQKEFDEGAPYDPEDWEFYRKLRDAKLTSAPKRLALYSGARGKYYNVGEDGSAGGDGLHILAPTPDLVDESNETDDFNDCSYVILYRTGDHRIVFGRRLTRQDLGTHPIGASQRRH